MRFVIAVFALSFCGHPLEAQEAIAASGSVADAGGNAIAAAIQFRSAAGESFEAATDQAGSFKLQAMPSGTYTIKIKPEIRGFLPISIGPLNYQFPQPILIDAVLPLDYSSLIGLYVSETSPEPQPTKIYGELAIESPTDYSICLAPPGRGNSTSCTAVNEFGQFAVDTVIVGEIAVSLLRGRNEIASEQISIKTGVTEHRVEF